MQITRNETLFCCSQFSDTLKIVSTSCKWSCWSLKRTEVWDKSTKLADKPLYSGEIIIFLRKRLASKANDM